MHQNCEAPLICIRCSKVFDYQLVDTLQEHLPTDDYAVTLDDVECPYCGGGIREIGE
jgi:DNA-directed RNA polymerase subunit RPC12/RpoP